MIACLPLVQKSHEKFKKHCHIYIFAISICHLKQTNKKKKKKERRGGGGGKNPLCGWWQGSPATHPHPAEVVTGLGSPPHKIMSKHGCTSCSFIIILNIFNLLSFFLLLSNIFSSPSLSSLICFFSLSSTFLLNL